MKLLKSLAGAVAIAALVLSATSARADNYVFGNSSGILSSPLTTNDPPMGDYLQLTTTNGVEFAPLGFYSLLSGTNLTINGDSGWFTATAEEGPGGDNYITGNNSSVASGHLRSFLSFNTSGLTANGPVLGATLFLDTYTVLSPGTETVDFLGGVNNIDGAGAIDSSADANYVLGTEQNANPNATDIAAIYTALGTGPVYGSFGYTVPDTNTQQAIGLDAAFISDINNSLSNANNSLFTVGEDDVLSTGSSVPLPSPLLGGAVLIAGLAMTRFYASRRVAPIV